MQTAFCSYACKTLLQAFCSHNSANLFIQQRHWALPLVFTAKMSGTSWGTDLGQLPIWMLWPHMRVYGQDWWRHGPSDVPTQPGGGAAPKSLGLLTAYGVRCKRQGCKRGARGNAEVSVQYLGTVSLLSSWILWNLVYTYFFSFFFDFLEHVRTKINEDSHKRYQALRYHV